MLKPATEFLLILFLLNIFSLFLWHGIIHLLCILSRTKMGFQVKKVCERIRQIRTEMYGEGHGAQKQFAKIVAKENYTTYRNYETKVVNLDFIQKLSERTPYRIEWILLGQLPKKKE